MKPFFNLETISKMTDPMGYIIWDDYLIKNIDGECSECNLVAIDYAINDMDIEHPVMYIDNGQMSCYFPTRDNKYDEIIGDVVTAFLELDNCEYITSLKVFDIVGNTDEWHKLWDGLRF